MGKKCEDICVPCECSTKSDIIRGNVNNQVDRMTYYVDTSQPLSTATPVTEWCSQAHQQIGHGSRKGGFARLSNMDFHSPRPTWLWLLLSAQSTSSKD